MKFLSMTLVLWAGAALAHESSQTDDRQLYSITGDVDRQVQEISQLTGKQIWRHHQWAVVRLSKDEVTNLPDRNRRAVTTLTLANLHDFFPDIKTPPTMEQEILSILGRIKTEDIEKDIKTLINFPGRNVNSKGNEAAL